MTFIVITKPNIVKIDVLLTQFANFFNADYWKAIGYICLRW